jgi:hypothetical protein
VVLPLAVLVVVVGAVLALALLRLRSVERDLRAARDLIEQASDQLEAGEIAAARATLHGASGHLTSATGSLHNHAELGILSSLPVAKENLAELRYLVGVASELSIGGERLLAAAAPLEGAEGTLEVPLSRGAIPVEAVLAAQREAEQLVATLPTTSDDGGSRLVGRLRDLRRTVLDEAVQRRNQLDVLARGLELIGEMSGGSGDRHYLIAVANTAEMRGSGGMILSYGALIGHEGDFELRQFGRIDELRLSKPIEREAVPTVPDDYLARWQGFDPLGLWRNATLAADLEITAPVLETMYLAATGVRPHGVIQVDPEGLAAILEGIGPVEVPELGTVTAANVVDLVLNQAYAQFPGIDERSDVLGDVAQAVFERLVQGEYPSLRPLAESLLRAVDGRHLLMHSVTSGVQEQLQHFGASGRLPAPEVDAVTLTVQNVSANKLDYYVDTDLRLTGERPAGDFGTVQAEVTVTNTAPAGVTEPRYVFGPFNDDQEVGLYRGAVSLYLPTGTTIVGTAGDPLGTPPVVQSEGGRLVVGFGVDVPAGSSRRVILDLELPPRPAGGYELLLVPSPRVRPTTASVSLSGDAAIEGSVVLDRTWRFASGEPPTPASRNQRPVAEG